MANIQIPDLLSAGPVANGDLLIISQSGLAKKIAASDFLLPTTTNINDSNVQLTNLINSVSSNLTDVINADVAQLYLTIASNIATLEQNLTDLGVTNNNDLSAAVQSLNQAIISNNQIIANQVNQVQVNILGQLTATVGTLNKAIVDNVNASFSQTLGIIGTLNNKVDFQSYTLNQAIISNAQVLANQITSVNASLTSNIQASLTQSLTAIATVNSAIASQLTTVTSNLNGVTSKVSTLIGSVNGLNSKWSVTLDSNGYISGLTSVNNGTKAEFNVLADKFTIGKPGASSNVQAFTVNTDTNPPTLTFAGKIYANSIVSGSIATANLYIGNTTVPGANYFALEGGRERMILQDGNGTERLRLGYLNDNAPGSNVESYGITVRDQGGNLILGAGGLGNNTVFGNNIFPATTARAYGNHVGDGNAIVGGGKYVLGNISIDIGAVGEGVIIMTSGLFTNGNATTASPPTPVVVTPPGQTPPYVPPEVNPAEGAGGM
ncbi:hypothetical protein UFOVP29_193 [uncultured Caudovirales phage]|uniref:Uncharacterized protein n=1 Tax=uncultured Caudovirales phage TaxID=2100421 RepID=A0A6J5KL88_9CAUD|nr:hypothetical protein UFOVP29_193 [uncultured Caudovirales phage]